MRNKPWFALYAQSPSRDGLACNYIKQELKKRGYPVSVIGGSVGKFRKKNWRYWIGDFRPDVVVVPRVEYAKRLRQHLDSHGHQFYKPVVLVVMAEFGFYETDENADFVACMFKEPKRDFSADLVCCMSLNDKRTLEFYYPDVAPEAIKITGQPRYDFFKKPWNVSRQKTLENFGIPIKWKTGKIVSIASRFDPRADFKNYNCSPEEKKNYKKSLDSGQTSVEIKTFIDFQRKGKRALVQLTKSLSAAFPDVLFVYKTHPGGGEATEGYERSFENCPNVVVVGGQVGFIGELFRVVACHVHMLCTTGLDGSLSGVPTINFLPFHSTELPYEIRAQDRNRLISDFQTQTDQEVVLALRKTLAAETTGSGIPLGNSKKAEYVHKLAMTDGCSTIRVVDELEKFVTGLDFAKKEKWRQRVSTYVKACLTQFGYPDRFFLPYDKVPFRSRKKYQPRF